MGADVEEKKHKTLEEEHLFVYGINKYLIKTS